MLYMAWQLTLSLFFFFNDTATTEIYTLSLHDALPISALASWRSATSPARRSDAPSVSRSNNPGALWRISATDRKSTRLNSSHANISYAVFCLKKKKNNVVLTHHEPGAPFHKLAQVTPT